MDHSVVLSTVLALLGACLSVFAGWQVVQRLAFLGISVTVPGEVVGVTDVRDGIECTQAPRVRFRTLSGREITFDSALSSGPSAWSVGAHVKVRYQPDQP